MTKNEAIEVLKAHPLYLQDWESEYYKTMSTAFKMSINSLEAWDKLIEEIRSLPIERGLGVFDCLCIIDKYLKEIETKGEKE